MKWLLFLVIILGLLFTLQRVSGAWEWDSKSQATQQKCLLLCWSLLSRSVSLSATCPALHGSTGQCSWSEVTYQSMPASPLCSLCLSCVRRKAAPQGLAAATVQRAVSAGIRGWKVLPGCWICYSHRVPQEITSPKITHSNPEGNLQYAFTVKRHRFYTYTQLKYLFALQLIISQCWIIMFERTEGQLQFEAELVYF